MNTKSIELNRNDFDKNITAEGYQVKYKGRNIGGAGIMGKSKSRGKNREADIREYSQSAERDIDSLINGHGPEHMFKNLIKILEESTPPAKSIDKEVLSTDFTGVFLLGEQLDGDRLIDLIKYFRLFKNQHPANESILAKLLSVYTKRFGLPFPR